MGTNFHSAWSDFGTLMKASHLNPALEGLDRGITYVKNVIIHCDGEIAWNPYTAQLSWNDTLRINFTRSDGYGILNTVEPDSVTVYDGRIAYVDLSEINNAIVTVETASLVTGATSNTMLFNRIVLGYRNAATDAFYPVHLQFSFDATAVARPYDVACTYAGYPPASGVMVMIPMVRTVVFQSGLPNSEGYANTAPTANAVFSIRKNGVQFATMTIAAAAHTATFVCSTQAELEAGDVLTVRAPNPQDLTMMDVGFVLAGLRGLAPPAGPPTPTTTTAPPSETTTTTTV